MLAFAFALATIAGAIDPPTLDELLEDADVEDRHRIEQAIFSADRSIAEIIALEDDLDRKIELLRPLSRDAALAFEIEVAAIARGDERSNDNELRIFATLSIDFEELVTADRRRPIPQPAAQLLRERRCLELGDQLSKIAVSIVQERALIERARALGCAWRSR